MADSKAGSRPTGMNIDTALVRELAEMLADTGLTQRVINPNIGRIHPAPAVAPPAPLKGAR